MTKCKNEQCVRKYACLRYTAPDDSYLQHYAIYKPSVNNEIGFKCKYKVEDGHSKEM